MSRSFELNEYVWYAFMFGHIMADYIIIYFRRRSSQSQSDAYDIMMYTFFITKILRARETLLLHVCESEYIGYFCTHIHTLVHADSISGIEIRRTNLNEC